MKKIIKFSFKSTQLFFENSINNLVDVVGSSNFIIITDENVFAANVAKLKHFNHIIIPAGEQNKNQNTVNYIIDRLLHLKADRQCYLVGVGGGVVTDITGYVASIYMRGLHFGFVPTSILAFVDAAIGGKNGIDVGPLKNIVGTINQPQFILHDYSFLDTLPHEQWVNGFAEIIKHSIILDEKLFFYLKENSIEYFKKQPKELATLIQQNVMLKCGIVQEDEWETGKRKILNFGHTLGHAIENTYQLLHGQAIAIGMVFAAKLSESFLQFHKTGEIINLLQQYELPTDIDFEPNKVLDYLLLDKKKNATTINYILLENIGNAIIYPINNKELESILLNYSNRNI